MDFSDMGFPDPPDDEGEPQMKDCGLCRRKSCGHDHSKAETYFVISTPDGDCIYCPGCEDWVKSADKRKKAKDEFACDDGHTKVYYDEKDCPACTLKTEIEELKEEIEDLNRVLRKRMRHTNP